MYGPDATRGGERPGPASAREAGESRFGLFDLISLTWAERGLIALVFAVLFGIGAAAALIMLQPSYESQSRLLVLLDSEDLTPGAAGSGGAFEVDQVMQSESEILNSDAVRRLALESLSSAGALNALTLKAVRDDFSISRAPNASVLQAQFEHADPVVAATTLNAIVEAYLGYRRDVLLGDFDGEGGLSSRRVQADAAYAVAQGELDAFLTRHALADFPAALTAAVTRVSTLQDGLLTATAERDAAQAGADALSLRLQNLPEAIELYVENGATNQLLELRLERERLLARYQPQAPAVVAVEREIEELQSFIAAGSAQGLGNIRTGPNPVRQALETDRLGREATARQEARRVTVLERQMTAAQAEVARLRGLAPEYERLAREATARSEAASALAGQAAEASGRRIAPGAADAVRVIERAVPPAEASSMKKLGVIAAFIFAAGAALFLGVIRGYWRRYLDPRAMPLPRPAEHNIAAAPAPMRPAEPVQVAASLYDVPPAYAPAPDASRAALADLPILARISERRPRRA
jgi:uncharacterized protein involved in exopolysaccharide biosynthesis